MCLLGVMTSDLFSEVQPNFGTIIVGSHQEGEMRDDVHMFLPIEDIS